MRFDRGKTQEYLFIFLIGLATFVILACFVTFIVNINKNTGIIPLIFLFLSIYFFLSFIYNTFIYENRNKYKKVKNRNAVIYVFLFVICIILYLLSYITLWK